MNKVIIIGGGASGIIAALKASLQNEVILLERNDKIGKKILLTGNGKCNYWNEEITLEKYYTDDTEALEQILKNKKDVLQFLETLGIYPKIKNGYYYPYSNNAASIREIFAKELIKRNVKVVTNCKITEIKKINKEFIIQTENETFHTQNLILATGSKSYPKTGSEGIGYEIAQSFHLKVNPVTPSLVGLKIKSSFLKDWEGIRTDAKVELYIDGIKQTEEIGEIQLTDYGVSGICIFNISGLASKSLYDKKKVSIKINFLPFLKDHFYDWFSKRNETIKNHTIEELLESVFHYKLMFVLLKEAGIDKKKTWDELNMQEKRCLQEKIEALELMVIDTLSFDRAQVCTGGISLKEINPFTMETKIEGLYITGEVLDVDGKCGGYNLAFAFITGYIAGSNIHD
jgi:predicted Rossmann fold flavoprotein